jgi:ribonuclease P protein component
VLPAANRLRTAADFRDTTRRGVKSARGCVVVYLKAPIAPVPYSDPRVGVIVTKAVGGAVERHRAARRIRGAVRPLLATLPRGASLVVRALPGADTDANLTRDLSACVASVVHR